MKQILLFVTLLMCNSCLASDFILGRYEAVFETNYGVDILFKENGKCLGRQILYPEQEGESTEITERICSWLYSEGVVSVKSKNGNTSYYQFIPKLSGLPHGEKSFKPGIIPLSGNFIVQKAYMWKLK